MRWNPFRKQSFSGRAPEEGAQYLNLPQIRPTGGTGYIQDVQPSYWFSPLQPVRPTAPPGTRVRQWPYQPGTNIVWTPGSEDTPRIGFDILRAAADSWDLLRLAIETVKDRLCSVEWEVRLKKNPDERKPQWQKRQAADQRIRPLEMFWARPDGEHNWSEWWRMALDDNFVLDATSIYLQRDLQGRIASAHCIDGATINRMITDQGFTPPPPQTAYQQVLYGLPAINLTTDDLVYAVRNPRTWKRYGYGPVEQCLVTIAIGLRRQKFQLNYYTEGTMPEGLIFMPAGVHVDKVKEVQDWFDTIMTGDLARRRRLQFLPNYGDAKDQRPNVVFPKEVLLKDEMDNWLWQIVAYAMGTSPLALQKMVNRASAQTSQEAAEEEGLEPKLQWMESVINEITQRKMGFDDLEVVPKSRREVDTLKQMQIHVGYVKEGVLRRNEVREDLGRDPDESPEADELMVDTSMGPQPLSMDVQLDQQQRRDDAKPTADDQDQPTAKDAVKLQIGKLRGDIYRAMREFTRPAEALAGKLDVLMLKAAPNGNGNGSGHPPAEAPRIDIAPPAITVNVDQLQTKQIVDTLRAAFEAERVNIDKTIGDGQATIAAMIDHFAAALEAMKPDDRSGEIAEAFEKLQVALRDAGAQQQEGLRATERQMGKLLEQFIAITSRRRSVIKTIERDANGDIVRVVETEP